MSAHGKTRVGPVPGVEYKCFSALAASAAMQNIIKELNKRRQKTSQQQNSSHVLFICCRPHEHHHFSKKVTMHHIVTGTHVHPAGDDWTKNLDKDGSKKLRTESALFSIQRTKVRSNGLSG
jgi:hypothetical protein